MSIFSKTHTRKALWHFRAKPGQIIWKLLISPTGILAGEERHPDEKTASLFALDVTSGKTLWRDKQIDEQWWFNSEQATSENIYIHKFRQPDMPEALGILVMNIHTGDLRWEQPDVAMLFELNDKLYAQREGYGQKEFFSLDARTGEVLEAFGSEQDQILSLRALVVDQDMHSQFSIPVTPEDESFGAISGILSMTLSHGELRGSIDFAEYGNLIVFSYHERITTDANAALRNMLRNELRILDVTKGEIVYADTLNSETPYPVPENFFINRGVLIYVKEKSEIIGVSLE